MSERDFQSELHNLVCAILRAHRNKEPETRDEIEAAVQRINDIAAALMPQMQQVIAAGVMALNTE